MKPITRKEFYLAKASGTYTGPTPPPVLREDYYLATLSGDYSGYCPAPVTRLDMFMSAAAGLTSYVPQPVTRIEKYWYAIAKGTGYVPEPVTREEELIFSLLRSIPNIVEKTASGNPITIQSAAAPFTELLIFGKTTQQTTTGAQLIDTNVNGEGNGITWQSNPDGSITINGTATASIEIEFNKISALEGEEYYLFGYANQDLSNLDMYIQMYTGTDSLPTLKLNTSKKDAKKTCLETAEYFTRIRIGAGVELNNVTVYPMISKQVLTSDSEFEPYTGGKPSPSPEYKQDMTNAGSSGQVNVGVGGKNMIPFPYLSPLDKVGVEYKEKGVTYTVQSDGGIHCVGTPESRFGPTISRIRYSEKILNTYAFPQGDTDGKVTLSGYPMFFDNNDNALFIYFSEKVGEQVNTIIYPQVEYGSTATSYMPYVTPQSLIVSTPTGLPGVPTTGEEYTYIDADGTKRIADSVEYFSDGTGRYVQRVQKFAGDSLIINNKIASNKGDYFTANYIDNLTDGVLCDKLCGLPYEYSALDKNFNLFRIFYDSYAQCICVRTPVGESYTVEQVQGFLNGSTVYVAIVEPIITPLSAEQIAAFKALTTYEPTTVVQNDAGCWMQVGYKAKNENYRRVMSARTVLPAKSR